MKVKFPFPFKNRDYLDFIFYRKIENKHFIVITIAPNKLYPKDSRYERAENRYSIYEIEVKDEFLEITSTTKTNPKLAAIPKSI